MKVKFIQSRDEGEFPDLTDGKIYDADEETVEINGEMRYFVYDDSGDEDPTPYPVGIFDVEPEMAATG
jgi:hypothetical protein